MFAKPTVLMRASLIQINGKRLKTAKKVKIIILNNQSAWNDSTSHTIIIVTLNLKS